jgi:cell division transport system permease protein
MRAQFVLSEIGIGLRRNLTMTIAVVVTTAISLALLGAGLLVQSQVNTMKGYWYGKVEVSVYLCDKHSQAPTCSSGPVSQAQREDILHTLEGMKPLVTQINYESKAQAYEHFKKQFKDSPDMLQNTAPDALPESYQVKLKDPKQFEVVSTALEGKQGVDIVQDQRKLLHSLFTILNTFRNAAWAICAIQIVAAIMLISNTIRVAAYSRRRETGIMRLVGSSNFYIQLPFLLEGALAGLVGGVLASGVVVALKHFFVDGKLRPMFRWTAFIGWDSVMTIIPILLITGVALSALASFVTLRKYLRV